MAKVRYVVFDFDGTCTQVEAIHARFLLEYGTAIGATTLMIGNTTAWDAAITAVRAASPTAGWTIAIAASAPAAADPYILAYEAAQWLLRQQVLGAVPDVYAKLYRANEPPLRPELGKVLADLDGSNIRLGFISNSARDAVAARVQEATRPYPGLFEKIRVTGDAAKFTVNEPAFDRRGPLHARFDTLPATLPIPAVGRPVYLRRGKYFDALCRFFHDHGEAPTAFPIEETLIVGDVWELDLAMPAALGAQCHLVARATPFETYAYERAQVKATSRDLTGVLETIRAANGGG